MVNKIKVDTARASGSTGDDGRPLPEYPLLAAPFDVDNVDIEEPDVEGLPEDEGDSER